jgi:hypothetical protein
VDGGRRRAQRGPVAKPDESREEILDRYERACAHADETIESLPLDATGQVPWRPGEERQVTLRTTSWCT